MDESRDASFGLRRVEIGIVGDSVVSRVATTMALPKGLGRKTEENRSEKERRRREAKERDANKKKRGRKD